MPTDTQVSAEAPPATAPPTRRRRRRLLAAVAVLIIAVAVVFAPAVLRLVDDPAGSAPVSGVQDVRIPGDYFDPPVIEVPEGATVTWHFEDGGVVHNVVGDGWESEALASGTFSHTFEQPGTYPYTCTLHWGMDGRVEVVRP